MTPEEEQRGRELAEKMPGLMFATWSKVPSPLSAALYVGLAGAGLAMLLKKSPWKWGMVAGGGGFLTSVVVKGSFAAGMMSGGMAVTQECIRNPQQVAAMYHDIFSPVLQGSVKTGWDRWSRFGTLGDAVPPPQSKARPPVTYTPTYMPSTVPPVTYTPMYMPGTATHDDFGPGF